MTHIHRRSFLKSSGVTLALPTLESLCGAKYKLSKPLKRMVFICTKLGLYPPSLFPQQPGPLAKFPSQYLSILREHHPHLTLFSGLSHSNQAGRLSHSSEMTWLTAAQDPGLDGFKNTISIDQLAANKLGYTTRYPSIVLSTNGQASQSYTENGVMIPAESSPSQLFSKLFLRGRPEQIAKQRQQLRFNKSILDGLVAQTKSLLKNATPIDRQRLEAYLESIRRTERNFVKQGEWLDKPRPNVNAKRPKDIRQKADIIGRITLMMNMIPLILQTDTTRVINLGIQIDHGTPNIPGINQEHHALSHHGKDPQKIKQLKIVESSILNCFAGLLTDLKQHDIDQSTLLDNTALLFGSNLGNANNHDYRNLPIILAGGSFKHGNYIAYSQSRNKPLCNLFLAMLRHMKIPANSFAQSTSTLTWT